jgi:hypothetical protein
VSSDPRLIGLVVEGVSDARTVPGLTDRVLRERAAVVDLEGARTFRGLDASMPFLRWSQVDHEAKRRPVPRKHGRFGGEPAVEDARTAYMALQCFVAQDPQPVTVLLVRDSDGKQRDRNEGLDQARRERDWPFPVIVGVAHTMRECWVLAGFVARNKKETGALATLRKELGFDPTERSEKLDASKETAKKNPKRVLGSLTDGDAEREEKCWTITELDRLRTRGSRNGLAAFLDEIEEKLVPLFAG